MKKKILIIVLLSSCAFFMGLEAITERIPRASVPGGSIIYIPSGKFLKYATFGYSSLAADLIYLWSIQYYSNYRIADRYAHLDHIFAIIAELDPRYLDPYEMGAIIAVYEARDPYMAFKILDRGLEKNPDQWIFPYEAGHYAQMVLKDYELARKYYKITMGIPNAPPIAKRLYANAAFKGMDYRTAWESWLEVFQTAKEERIKKIASNHLYQVKSAMDVKRIEEAIGEYKQKYGKNPSSLDLLVKTGILDSIPQDLDGNDYHYDPEKGEVESQTKWWKR
jgi:tetratricopeptide (TPR) repeat protein